MKLFSKYNRINLITTVAIFLLAGIAFYFLLRFIIIDQVDGDLRIEQNEIETAARSFHHVPAVIPVRNQYTTYNAVQSPTYNNPIFRTLKKFDDKEEEKIYVREIEFNLNVQGQWYLVKVGKSLEGTDDLLQSIIIITTSTILLILIATVFVNRLILKKLWQPFYETLNRVGRFKLGNQEKLAFSTTQIEEFDLLNKTLQESIGKAEHDYLLLREFTENASHELQTPLAIIRSKLDVLIQEENLSEQQSNAVQSAYDAIQRLTRINQTLLLLAKIENRQFEETKLIDMKISIENKLNQFHELCQTKNILVSAELESAKINMNIALADILLNNLLSNAIKHSVQNGKMNIHLSQGMLTISNTGNEDALNAEKLFTRFYKQSNHNENNGLGLAVVKQICEVSACNIQYNFEKDNIHVFNLVWDVTL